MSVQQAIRGYRVALELVHATPLIDNAIQKHSLRTYTMYIFIGVSVGQTAAQLGLFVYLNATSMCLQTAEQILCFV